MLTLEWTVKGDFVPERVNDPAQLKRFMGIIGEVLLESTKDRFRTQVDPSGSPWVPLSKDYQVEKKRNKGKILTLFGDLQRQNVYRTGDDWVAIYNTMKYANTHQYGRPRIPAIKKSKKGKKFKAMLPAIPARPFVGLSKADEEAICDELEGFLTDQKWP